MVLPEAVNPSVLLHGIISLSLGFYVLPVTYVMPVAILLLRGSSSLTTGTVDQRTRRVIVDSNPRNSRHQHCRTPVTRQTIRTNYYAFRNLNFTSTEVPTLCLVWLLVGVAVCDASN
ncbi:hypothetical protein EJ08DRAFT_226107 [Tothia fuscella]|uniref:Uncharacterized protein n=1 Tax=Tothia fuscella TaxID=1048955 RepID=A0A9P4P2A1_9PEZI|nr:hypothetical protein EJ08DRAFT_226107 [Tothia fuscella]